MADAPRQIVLLADRITNADQAGTLRAFVERLAGRGLSTTLICVHAGDDVRRGLNVIECPGLGDGWRLAWAVRALPIAELAEGPALLHVLQARMAPAGLEIAERWRIPCVQSVEEFQVPESRFRLSRRWSRGLIATSRELGDDLTLSFGVPPEWVRVVPRGIAVAEPRPVGRDEASVRVVGTAGPLVPGSGFATFLNAAKRVLDTGIDAEFVLVGQGEEEGELRRRAERLRIADRLTFAGDAAVGLSFWDVLDVYCQPSTVPTVGRNLARALAHALPAAASDIDGLRSLIAHDATGLLVPPGDTHALAAAILDLLTDRPRAEALGRAGREFVAREYDLDREAAALASLYHALIDAESRATIVAFVGR